MNLNFLNLLSRMPSACAQGILWGLMALGVYITFRVLDIADLSVDGTFATGGAVTVMLIIGGCPAGLDAADADAFSPAWIFCSSAMIYSPRK